MTEKYGQFKEPTYLGPGLSAAGRRPAQGGSALLHVSPPKTGKGADATFGPLLPLGPGKPLARSRRSSGKPAPAFVPPSSHQSAGCGGPFLAPAREKRKLRGDVQPGKRGIFAGLSTKTVFGKYGYVSQPAGGAKRAEAEHLVPFRPAQHVRRGSLGEFASYEWRAAPPAKQQKQERKALAPFRPAHTGGGPFSRFGYLGAPAAVRTKSTIQAADRYWKPAWSDHSAPFRSIVAMNLRG